MNPKIKIIDLFAGPGGLGEGFSSYKNDEGCHPFDICASVEKDLSAHRTLTLRAFFRQFRERNAPKEYYDYIRNGAKQPIEDAFKKFTPELNAALNETLLAPRALGSSDDTFIYQRIEKALEDHSGYKVVIGGPPCQAYSVVGRARNRGNKNYLPEKDKRHFLYQEYLRVLDIVQPEVFIMENVKGILTAKVNGGPIFKEIINDLQCPTKAIKNADGKSYDIYALSSPLKKGLFETESNDGKDFIICAEDYGIPQQRHRVILFGVQKGIRIDQTKESLLEDFYSEQRVTVSEAIGDLPELRSGITKVKNIKANWLEFVRNAQDEVAQADPRYSAIKYYSSDFLYDQGSNFVPEYSVPSARMPSYFKQWIEDKKIKGYLNHEARSHMISDLQRYYFAASYAKKHGGKSPMASDYPSYLTPKHKNWQSGHFADRFKVQAENKVSSTITSHIAKDGHYFIHYDPKQCRSLTVREAARIQTFPDNYFFIGNRTEQYTQVGNAVPPLLANFIADVVYNTLENNRNADN